MTKVDVFESMHNAHWRLSNLYTIQDKKGNRVPFVPNMAQLKYLENCTDSDITLKARQLGFTTLVSYTHLTLPTIYTE